MQRKIHIIVMLAILMLGVSISINGVRAGGIVSSTATDAYENDNTPALASLLVVDDVAQWHSISIAGDIDWTYFPVQAGHVYRLTATTLSPFTVVFQWQGHALVRQSDDGLLIIPRETGNFYVGIRSADGQGAPDRVYLLQLSDVSAPATTDF